MSYSSEIQILDQEVNYLVHFSRRYFYNDVWEEFDAGADIFRIPWTLEPPLIVRLGNAPGYSYKLGSSYEEILSAPYGDSETIALWFDSANGYLYFKNSGTLDSYDQYYFDIPYFLSTKDVGWHIFPDDGNYEQVQYNGILTSLPQISSSVNQTIYGFFPEQNNAMTCNNRNGFFNDFSNFSVSNGIVTIYRVVGDFALSNVELVFRGYSTGIAFNNDNVSLSYTDMGRVLSNNVYRTDYRSNAIYGSLEQTIYGTADRVFIAGRHRWVLAFNGNYDPTDSNTVNRLWRFGRTYNPSYAAQFYTTDNALTGSNTTTRTYLDSVYGLFVGQWLNGGVANSPVSVTAVGVNYVDTTPAFSAPKGASDTLSVPIVQDVILYHRETEAIFVISPQDVETTSGTTDPVFYFKTTVEATYSLPENINSERYDVWGSVEVGQQLNFLSTGNPLGTVSAVTGKNQNPVQTIYELLYWAGFFNLERYYDSASFIQAASDVDDLRVDISSPFAFNSSEPEDFRAVISKICETALLKLYVKSGKWFISAIKPLTAATQTVGRTQILTGFDMKVDINEIVKAVKVRYNRSEVYPFFFPFETGDFYLTSTTSDEAVIADSQSVKTKTIDLAVYSETIAEAIRDRYFYLFQKQLTFVNIELGLPDIGIKLDDIVTILKEDYPFFPFTDDKTFSVVSIDEMISTIKVQLFDQAGIEANSGSW